MDKLTRSLTPGVPTMLFDTPLLKLAANAPVASSSTVDSAPSTAPGLAAGKKRRRSSSITRDGSLAQEDAGLPKTEINVEKLLEKMKQVEGGAARAGARDGAREGKGKGKDAGSQNGERVVEGKGKERAKEAAAPVQPGEGKKSRKKNKKAKGDASSPAARPVDLPEAATATTPVTSTSAPASAPRIRHSAPSQTVTASTATASTKGGSVQDKLRAQLAGGKFRMLNETLYTTSGDEAHRLMKEDGAFDDVSLRMSEYPLKSRWLTDGAQYHIGFRSQAATWPVHPLALIAQSLLSTLAPNSLIADFGCGDAALARSLCPPPSASSTKLPPIPSLKLPSKLVAQKSLKVVSFDLVSQSSFVVEAECSSVPLPGGTAGGEIVDAVVCCLSLMGTDWVRMVREAKRVLKDGLRLWSTRVMSG